ncbi:MAG: copper-resistance protein CopA family, partial [Phenylobacterium sp.]|nr:copper-resistance protein CopA family [Phenylobacterium sp.]
MRDLDRRRLLRRAALVSGGLAATSLLPTWAQGAPASDVGALPSVSGEDISLTIDHAAWKVDGRAGHAVSVNGTLPAPLIRLKEGQTVRLSVTNRLAETASIHWHGMLVPVQMDGVPGVSFPGIPAGQTFVYEFPVKQSGTYWYHSHSGLQEQEGLYGPII